MKKSIATFMAILCMVLYCGNISAKAAEPTHCPDSYCGALLVSQGATVDHWLYERVFTDTTGASITCYEHHYIDKVSKVCPNGHGVVWTTTTERITHSLSACPYK